MQQYIFGVRVIAAMFIVCLLARPSVAQDKAFGQAGTTEIAGSISFSSITPVNHGETDDAYTLFSIGPEIGYFITDGLQLGFSPGITFLPGMSVVTPPQGEGATILQLFATAAYNFVGEGRPTTPFLQVPFGYTSLSSGSETQSGFSWGVKGGVKIVATGHLLLTCYGEYLVLTFNPDGETERYGLNFLSFGVSVGGFF